MFTETSNVGLPKWAPPTKSSKIDYYVAPVYQVCIIISIWYSYIISYCKRVKHSLSERVIMVSLEKSDILLIWNLSLEQSENSLEKSENSFEKSEQEWNFTLQKS